MVAHLLNKGKARYERGREQGDYRGRWRGDGQEDRGEMEREMERGWRGRWRGEKGEEVLEGGHPLPLRPLYCYPSVPLTLNQALLLNYYTGSIQCRSLRCSSRINKATWLPARSLSLSLVGMHHKHPYIKLCIRRSINNYCLICLLHLPLFTPSLLPSSPPILPSLH